VSTTLGIQQARVMRHIVACLAVQYFTRLFSKMARFSEKNINERKRRVDLLDKFVSKTSHSKK